MLDFTNNIISLKITKNKKMQFQKILNNNYEASNNYKSIVNLRIITAFEFSSKHTCTF